MPLNLTPTQAQIAYALAVQQQQRYQEAYTALNDGDHGKRQVAAWLDEARGLVDKLNRLTAGKQPKLDYPKTLEEAFHAAPTTWDSPIGDIEVKVADEKPWLVQPSEGFRLDAKDIEKLRGGASNVAVTNRAEQQWKMQSELMERGEPFQYTFWDEAKKMPRTVWYGPFRPDPPLSTCDDGAVG